MSKPPFSTPIEKAGDGGTLIAGPFRGPLQMLADQEYDGHASIHDDSTAQKLGFKGGTIEGPTHFSQVTPLAVHIWGPRFFEVGCVSAHYRNAVFEGEKVRAFAEMPPREATKTNIFMEKEDGTEVLRGSISMGPQHPATALDERLNALKEPGKLVILRDVHLGDKKPRLAVKMDFEQHMGAQYPFSLAKKLTRITENSDWYDPNKASGNPYGRAIIPFEMLSVLMMYRNREDLFDMKGPAVGLFADQEIRLLKGPIFVGEPYEMEREVIRLSDSKRTESLWMRTTLFKAGTNELMASMLLNHAIMKDSYARYQEELAAL
jgi:hypothetical protein